MDKPLHVQVAEALGCRPCLLSNGDWFCDCGDTCPAEGYITGGDVRHYDTDWSATGPLIDRFGLVVYGTDRPWVDAPSHKHISRDGETVLVAICNLVIALKEAGKLVPGSVGHEMPKEGPYLLPSTEMKPWERMP